MFIGEDALSSFFEFFLESHLTSFSNFLLHFRFARSLRKSALMSSKTSFLESPPASVLNQILVLLPSLSLISVSRTSRFLRSHSQKDLLWAKFVKESVPKCRQSLSPFPCDSWKELYISYYPFWFLPRRKIWFSDKPSNGSACEGEVVIARYDLHKGCIEAYRLLAEREDYHFVPWERDPDVMIYTFSPKISLSRDDPVIKLDLGWRRSLNVLTERH